MQINLKSDSRIKAYLRRIGLYEAPTLRYLQEQHLKTVPYENLDIIRNIPISLKTEDLYEKIVTRRRGGYCFELNGLFAWLLRGLGYKVEEHLARYLRNEQLDLRNEQLDLRNEQLESGVPMQKHRVLRVRVKDMDYICDVGMGAVTPMKPLPMVFGQIIEQKEERYKLEREMLFGNALNVLYEWKKNKWSRIYSFSDEKSHAIDFVMPSFYCENHPGSFFRKMDMVHMFTEEGRKTVAGRELRVYTSHGMKSILPGSEGMYRDQLKQHFGIDLRNCIQPIKTLSYTNPC